MGKVKAKQRTITTIVVMTVLAIAILLFYFYWSNRTDPLDEASQENLSEVDKLLQKDLELYYPETPREVVKLFGSMTKTLYSNLEDDDVEALAIKIRELYDKEFIDNNPQEAYLTSLYTDIAEWKDKGRRITNDLLVNDDMEQQQEIDGIQYSINYISFTIQENGKFIETWKVLLRQDEDSKWKILGWETSSRESSAEQ